MTNRKGLVRAALAGLTISTTLMLAAPAALAQEAPKQSKTCIKLLGLKVCLPV